MTKTKAICVIANFLHSHLTAGDFWDDPTYAEDVQALKKLGYGPPPGDPDDRYPLPPTEKERHQNGCNFPF